MPQERPAPRYAHAEGHTDLCFSDDGTYLVTCGSEGDLRIWKGFDDDDPRDKCVGEKAFAVAQQGDKLYVGSDHNNVQIFSFPDGELDGVLTRFTAPVTTISVSKDGSYVAAGSCDMKIHLVDTATSKITFFEGHKAPILHVTIDPKNEYLASSSCDGTVRIWNITDQSVVKTWPEVTSSSNSFDSAETVCHVSWESTTGRLIAIPQGLEIKVYQRSTWNAMMTLQDPENSKKFGLTSWSSCGTYLAASTVVGRIVVWNTIINRVTSSSVDDDNKTNISALCWNPDSKQKQLAICDTNGQLTVIGNCISTTNSSNGGLASMSTGSSDREKPVKSKSTIDFEDDDFPNLTGDNFDDDPDDPDAISLEKIKSDYSFIDGDVVPKALEDDDASSMKSVSIIAPRMPLVELQPPFQPTSTPVHLQRRFMVFNDVGYVRQTNTEDENVIDVDFHDVSIHHAFRINNLLNHILAALSPEALVLACEKTEESMSKLVCRLFNSWDDSKEWNIEMNEDESIEAIAIGHKWIAVATSLWYLRIFSLSGVQREIINLPGPIVSMCGSNNYLFVVYHCSVGLPDNQNLAFQVFTFATHLSAIVPAQPVPLSPKSTLKWVGLSDEMNPCILDSNGILKIYVYKLGSWSPICDVDEQWKESSNHHFVIGISEELQNIRCILCKGSYYPATTPHPFITEIAWKIPVCEKDIDKGMHEEKLWRSKIADKCLNNDNDSVRKEILGTALKLFALCCQTSHEMRAFELCEFVDELKFTDLALKYSARARNDLLVERLSQLLTEQKKSEEEKADEFDFGPSRRSYMSNGDHDSYRNDSYHEPEPRNYQSQELFTESKTTQESSNYSNDNSVSLILEMKKKKKSLSEQKSQVIPRRKINPFRKGLPSNDVSAPGTPSNISAGWNKESQDTFNGSLPDSQDIEKTNSMNDSPVVDETESTSRKRKSPEEPAEKNPEKKKPLSKLQAFAFKK
ncbi:WD repeat and HMG-box DNA-binding protein 1 [Planococcus citri]|uniref:WD repeat and HMG-box DNA-binding protein 1 n=1 Tax=Planococcus citri TaxID=170843 RepID=UPI0031F79E3F